MAGAPTGRTGTRRGLPGISLGLLAADLAQEHGGLAPDKARCLLQPVFLYWLHERDA